MNLQTFTLPNGIRLVHDFIPNQVSHCGIFINAGTRDEADTEHGIAHLIEHTIFKGTEKRNVFQVLNRLENIGADLNAYTEKEDTCIYATFLNQYYDRTLELFQDIFFHSIFPEKEIEKEKQVVFDEIRSYQDTPAEQIFDDFEDLVFAGHPLGKNILGSKKSLKKISGIEIRNFIRRNYHLDQVVIASVGNIHFSRLVKIVTKYFSDAPERFDSISREPFFGYKPFSLIQKKKIFQVHCILGVPAYPFHDLRRFPLALLNNMLGGPILNSRLSLALRERNGLTYYNESNYTAYSDAGIIHIYFGTDPVYYDKALAIVYKELQRLRVQKLTPIQLHTIQKQLIGQLAISQESFLSLMLAIGKNYLFQNRFDSFEFIVKKIESITAVELQDIANEIFDLPKISTLTFQPIKA
ncbi:MAG: pitrilysin family protein [Bacteroidales bacterium]|nr:insulinase family protein [Bacteroidales bacterium]MDD4602260.1 pitrilysin family protein [Bacteroidales bacterium]